MIEFKGIYKSRGKVNIEDLNLKIDEGIINSIECTDEVSGLLIDMIIGDEVPAKGSIVIGEESSWNYFKKDKKRIGIVLNNQGFYDNLTVDGYIKFFKDLFDSEEDMENIFMRTALMDIRDRRIRELSLSGKKRLAFARELLKNPEIMIVQQPILNMENSGARVIVEILEYLKGKGVTVMITSPSLKNTVILGDLAYVLDEKGLSELNDKIENEEDRNKEAAEQDKLILQVKKIPAKAEDKILLFNPTDIDYIESVNGVCNLNVSGEEFQCNLSLGELEERLKNFGFFRCHRSYLVNLQEVNEIVTWTRNSFSLSLNDKKKSSVPLAKGRIDQLKEILKI